MTTAWLIGVIAVFKFSDDALGVMVGIGLLSAAWLLVGILPSLRYEARRTSLKRLSQRSPVVVEPPRSSAAVSRFLAFVGDARLAETGWTEQEKAQRAADPQMVVRTVSDERLALIVVGVDAFVPQMPVAQVWVGQTAGDEWRRYWPEAIAQMPAIVRPLFGAVAVHVPSADLTMREVPAGFVVQGRFLRRTAGGERQEVCYLVAAAPRRRGSSLLHRRAQRRRVASTEVQMGMSYRRAVPLGVVECAGYVVRPLTRFDGDDVARLLDASMLDEGRSARSLSSARRHMATMVTNGWRSELFVVTAGQEEIIGILRVDRVLTDARSCAVRVNLAAPHRGRGSELAIAVALSERLRAINVDFLMVPVTPEHGFDAGTLEAHGFVAIGERPSCEADGRWTTTHWFELDLRQGEDRSVPH